MSHPTAKTLLAVSLAAAVLLGGTVVAGYKSRTEAPAAAPAAASSRPSLAFLPREVSQSLEITAVPASRPVPMVIGTYWNCHLTEQEFEICDLKIVVCEGDDQSFCFEL